MKTCRTSCSHTFKSVFQVGCLSLLVLFAGCGKKPTPHQKIEGQVFIALKGGQSLKLGAVPVLLVDSNAAIAHVRTIERLVVNKLASLSAQRNEVSTELQIQLKSKADLKAKLERLDATLKETDEGLREVRASSEEMIKLGAQMKASGEKYTPAQAAEAGRLYAESSGYMKVINERLPIMRSNQLWYVKKLMATSNRVSELQINLATIHTNLQNQVMPKPLLNQSWPGIIQSTMTDADGKFSLSIPVGTNLLIVAYGNRELFGTEEDYLWIVPPLTQQDSPLLLNNANFFHFSETKTY